MTARIENDAYQTPAWCVDTILPYLDFQAARTFLEPCRGEGRIYDRIAPRVPTSHWCEIDGRLHGESRDYLKRIMPRADLIATNPPFSLAIEFLTHSLRDPDATVIYLLRLSMLGSSERRDFWNKNPPSHVFVLTPRPIFCWVCETKSCKAKYPPGTTKCEECFSKVKPQSDNSEYAWFCWDRAMLLTAPSGIRVLGKEAA